MRKKLPLFIGALFVVFSATACEGPVGPRGPAGADGTDGAAGPAGPTGPAGENALNTCSDCHSSDATIVAIEQQFDLSPHGFPQFEVREPVGHYTACQGCHTSQGFVAAATGTTADFTGGVASMNCRTCHQIHSDVDGDGDWEVGDLELWKTDAVTITLTGATIDFGGDDVPGSNTCASCHQARSPGATIPSYQADLTTMFPVTSGHYGVHYSGQANIFAAELPTEIEFGEGTTGMYGPHVNVSCNGCHMGFGVDGVTPMPSPTGQLHHTFNASTAVCATCHDASFDYGPVAGTEMKEDLTYLAACLEAEGVVTAHYDTNDGHYQGLAPVTGGTGYLTEVHVVGGTGITHPEPFVAAYLALQVLFEDGSFGVHQPRYAPDIATAALTFMETNSTACAAITP